VWQFMERRHNIVVLDESTTALTVSKLAGYPVLSQRISWLGEILLRIERAAMDSGRQGALC
jgi:hypothetical protein